MYKWFLCVCLFLVNMNLQAETKVLAFSGSTREASLNKKLINEAAYMASEMGATVTLIDLKDYPIPFYDGDLEDSEGMPENAQALRHLFLKHDIIVIASPNYNEGPSAVLKNVLDWVSRDLKADRSREAYAGKKFVLLSASTGKSGGIRALPYLQHIIDHSGGSTLPEFVAIPHAHQVFDEDGHLIDTVLRDSLQVLIEKALAL